MADDHEETIITPGGAAEAFVQSLPGEVVRRVDALKNLRDQGRALDAKFRKEVAELEKKYLKLAQPLYEKRAKFVTGAVEPTDAEAARDAVEDDEDAPPRPPVSESNPVKGVPEFWLTALSNNPHVSQLIHPEDEDALKHLTDIKLDYLTDSPGFKLTFVFSANEYFTNKELVKTYFLEESEDPLEGDTIYDHAEGTDINWKEGKDLSVTVEIKKQRHKTSNKTRTIKKTVPKETFFNFFKAPALPDDDEIDEEMLDDIDERLQFDYEVGELIKDKIIPSAVDWFTGEAFEYESDDEDEDYEGYGDDDDEDLDGDENDDDDDDEDDDEDEDDAPPRGGARGGRGASRGGRGGKGRGAATGAAGDKPPECKQQ
ncbi:nucleosome assembly protein-domain-containing protein [Entophlyctis helioformis]|nr:nucleosome assembly protein-domain-containing protein [Entophlyctis helioformis]